jgi:CheY-like chemotaxis protein
MSGIELLRCLKQDPTSTHIPVIVMTSLRQPGFRAGAMSAG